MAIFPRPTLGSHVMVKTTRQIGVIVTDAHDKMPYQVQGKDGKLLLCGMFFREKDVVEFQRPEACTLKRRCKERQSNQAGSQKMLALQPPKEEKLLALMPPQEEDTILKTWQPPALLESIQKPHTEKKGTQLQVAAGIWMSNRMAALGSVVSSVYVLVLLSNFVAMAATNRITAKP
jgi:hypothetical protein